MKTYLAKTIQKSTPGHTVFMHCKLSGQVAGNLIDLVPKWLMDHIMGPGWDKKKLCFGVSTHDVGKITLVFQTKIHSPCRNSGDKRVDLKLIEYAEKDGLCTLDANGAAVVKDPGHDLASMLALLPYNEQWSIINGAHHGRLRGAAGLSDGDWAFDGTRHAVAPDPLTGYRDFSKDRGTLLRMLAHSFGLSDQADIKSKKLPFHDFVDTKKNDIERWLRGLVAVSDWIASGDYLNKDPLQKRSKVVWKKQVRNACTEAGFNKVTFRLTEAGKMPSFKTVFGWDMHDSQHKLLKAVRDLGGPGVAILEEVMGRGKTEAALFAGLSCMLDNDRPATGMTFLLPTKATSDAIYKNRVVKFMKKIVKGRQSWAKLAHQDAWLYDMGAEASLYNSWFAGSKKQLLHAFSVGTVDQAMMAVINVKHAAVRSFALAGRVVIIDEVHSYDAYMQTLIVDLVQHLVELGCRVIMLSATLTSETRSKLLGAGSTDARYPLVSWRSASKGAVVKHAAPVPPPSRTVQVEMVQAASGTGRAGVMSDAIKMAAAGGKVLWIENTVAECQGTADALEAMALPLGIPVKVVHAKYVKGHRAVKEAELEKGYGKESVRGEGCITVTTQVAEQSLDIDADYLITALCPIDMLLQRIGRLYRHDRGPRPWGAIGKCTVMLTEGLPLHVADMASSDAFGNSRYVYQPYVLARTLEVLREFLVSHACEMSLPGDIRRLVEDVYKFPAAETAPVMDEFRATMEERRELLESRAWQSGALDTDPVDDEVATTRYIEDAPRQILLLRGIVKKDQEGWCELTTYLGDTVRLHGKMTKAERVSAARALNKCLVHDSSRKAPAEMLKRVQDELVPRLLAEVVSMSEQMAVVRVVNGGYLQYFKSLNGNDGPVWLAGERSIPLRYLYTESRGLRGVL